MRALLLFTIWTLAVGTSARAGEPRTYPRPELLVESNVLAKAPAGEFIVLDVRESAPFNEGHIPGARRVDPAEWAKAFGDGTDATGWSSRIGNRGISTRSKVVVYDDAMLKDAARIWWILRYWGIDDVKLLNGGWRAWKSGGFPTDKDSAKPTPSVEVSLKPRAERLAKKDQLLQSLTDKSLQIIDARSEKEFCGIEKMAKRGGAIPGAKHLDWSDLVNKEDHRFKDADRLRALFRSADIDLSKPTATHCQSGGRAAVMVFVMELMGAKDVSNYYASWAEWGNATDTPVEPGKPKAKQ